MNYYQEITLIDQMDVEQHRVHSGLYQILHKKLRFGDDGESRNIGIAFPKYQYNPARARDQGTLGNKIRLFAQTEAELKLLNLAVILEEYADYAHISGIKEVGNKATHYEVYYRHRTTGVAKKARRLEAHFIKKFGQAWLDNEFGGREAVIKHCQQHTKFQKMPFVRLKSTSNGHNYTVIFERQIVPTPTDVFSFDSFGLSSKDNLSSVPAW